METNASPLVRQFDIRRYRHGNVERVPDAIAAEEPLGIFLSWRFKDSRQNKSLALTMRTPGNDFELVAGYLLTEGIIRSHSDLLDLRFLGSGTSNEVVAELAPSVDVDSWRLGRETVINSSCGICGKRSSEALAHQFPSFPVTEKQIWEPAFIERLPELMHSQQSGFDKTGGLHAACAYRPDGLLLASFEDIGRHNALDKLIGSCLLQNLIPLSDVLLFLSSRSSFELVQKTVMAGARILTTVGAPSSLAVETARQYGVTLIGFVRSGRFNVYSGEWRIKS